jgi:archaellum component FlaC
MRLSVFLAALVLVAAPGVAQADVPAGATFGTIKAPSFEQAKAQAFAWLKETGAGAETLRQAEALWDPATERSLLERTAETLMLGDADARKLIADLRRRTGPAPAVVPDVLTDATKSAFCKANLGLYFAKQLAERRVYEEALEVLKATRPEQVVDPAAYYFFKAVCENKLRKKQDATASIDRLLTTVSDVPERYTVVAALMKLEMANWKDNDLGDIARRMDEVEGRLDNAQGGPKTQDKQDEIVKRLAALIKELEDQQNNSSSSSSSSSGSQGTNRSSGPAPDSLPLQGAGEGRVDTKRLLQDPKLWGTLPEKDRIKALEQISREYPPHVRESIEHYLRQNSIGFGNPSSGR